MADSSAPNVVRGIPAARKQTGQDDHDRIGPAVQTLDYLESPQNPDPARALHVHQLIGILRSRIAMIIAIALAGTALAVAVAFLIPAKYTARAQIVVEPVRTVSSSAGTAVPARVDALAIDTQMTMLTARDHLRAVLTSLREDAAAAPEPAATTDSVAVQEKTQASGDSWIDETVAAATQWFTDLVSEAAKEARPIVPVPTFDEFESTLRVDQERRSRVITVRYTSEDPAQAAAIANRVVQLYLQSHVERTRDEFRTELSALTSQVSELERSMAATERTIRQRLNTDEPLTEEASSLPLRQLQRKVAENAQLYMELLQQQRQVRNRQQTAEAPVRILSLAAPPERPSTPDPKLFILPALLLSLIGGGVLAVVLARFDRTLRSEQQVHAALGVPCLALIPRPGWLAGKRLHNYLLRKPFSPYAEAIRSIGASLWFAPQSQTPKVVLVTSSVRSEGKTTLATSLAVYAARLQCRVLLIDLDFRNASVARKLKLKSDSGLLDLIVSERRADDAVQTIPELGLDVLTMPECPLDPVALFANGELHNVLRELRETYDYIIIDGPPLLGVTESGLLASLADVVLFTVRWGSTRREIARHALAELNALGWTGQAIAERVRAVVSHVNLRQHARYQYGDAAEVFAKNRRYLNYSRETRLLADLRAVDSSDADEKISNLRAAE